MIRRELFKLIGGYDEDFQTTQDYDLWRRLIKITKFANLPEFLLLYRVHEENASKVFPDLQRNNSIRIAIDLMNDLLGDNSGYSFFAESTGNKDKIIVKVKILMRVYHEFSFQEKLTNDEKKLIRQDVGKRIIKMVKPLLKKYPHLIYWYIFGRIWRYI
jgi:hypothetical protein